MIIQSTIRKLLSVLGLLFLISASYALTVTQSDLKLSVTPQTVQPGQTFTLTVNYFIKAHNDWYDVATGGRGIFFIIKIGDKEYRAGKNGCVEPNTFMASDKCDIPYKFDDSPLQGTSSFTLPAPDTAGTYTIKVSMYINRARWSDKLVLTKTTSLTVQQPSAEYKPPTTKQNVSKTNTPPSQHPGTCEFKNIQIFTTPSTVYEGDTFDLHITFSYYCTRNDPRGPALDVYLKDENGRLIKAWRLGDQGYTTDLNKDYYFSPSGGQKEIVIPALSLPSGIYFIYLRGFYDDALSFDDEIFPTYRAYTLYILSKERAQPSSPTTTFATTCPENQLPLLVMTAWADQSGAILQSPAVSLGTKVYAVAKLRNPYSSCKYDGNVKIEIRKDILGGDSVVSSNTYHVILNPGDEKIIKLEFVPSEPGEYHFDVYWNNKKYGKNDVMKRYGTISCSSLDPTGCYAGPDLKVYQSTQEVKTATEKGNTINVVDYWFEQYGKNVTELVEGVPALGCVSLVSPTDTSATVTVQVKAFAGIKQIPILGDAAPDPVKAEITRDLVFTANQPITLCAKFVPRQTSAVHNEMYYLAVKINGKEIGIFPESKDGAVLIPKKGSGNPFVTGEDETNSVILVSHGWYTEDGEEVSGSVPSGTYLVRVELMNTGGHVAQAKIKVKIRKDKDFWFDRTIDSCDAAVTLAPNETKTIDCPFDLSDGRYHYEIYLNGKKIVSRGPTIAVGLVGIFEKYVSPVIKTIGVPGIIILLVLFFTGPYWIPFLISTVKAWQNLFKFLGKK